MHLVTVLTIVFVIFLLITLCGWCCNNASKTQQGTTFTTVVAMPQPMVAHNTSNTPYPTQPHMMPQPQMVPTVGHIGFAPYPHPPQQAPYPPQQPGFIGGAPFTPYPGYPPQTSVSNEQNPPSYAEATSAKQPAYNPNFR